MRQERAYNFYNLTNISPAGSLERGGSEEMRTDASQSLSFFETEMTNRTMAIKNNIIARMKFGALMR